MTIALTFFAALILGYWACWFCTEMLCRELRSRIRVLETDLAIANQELESLNMLTQSEAFRRYASEPRNIGYDVRKLGKRYLERVK